MHDAPVRILRLPEVLTLIGIGRSAFYALLRDGKFVPPIKLGPNSVGWVNSDISKWIADRAERYRVAPAERETRSERARRAKSTKSTTSRRP